jgi:hypothetical protein
MAATLKIYDPLKAVKRMEKAGVKKELAESIAGEIRESQDCIINDLATKKDLEMIEQKILIKIGKMIYISTGLIITMIGIAVAIIKI